MMNQKVLRMKAQEWETVVTSYIHPFFQEQIILGIIWGKSPGTLQNKSNFGIEK